MSYWEGPAATAAPVAAAAKSMGFEVWSERSAMQLPAGTKKSAALQRVEQAITRNSYMWLADITTSAVFISDTGDWLVVLSKPRSAYIEFECGNSDEVLLESSVGRLETAVSVIESSTPKHASQLAALVGYRPIP